MNKIFENLTKLGYGKGDSISYFEFNDCVETCGMEIDQIDIDEFQEKYQILVG